MRKHDVFSHCLLFAVAVSSLAGTKTVVRTLKNVLNQAATITGSATSPQGFNITLNPAAFTLQPGRTSAVRITITQKAGTPLGEWRDGAIVWTSMNGADTLSTTRIPVVVKAAELASRPAEVRLKGWTTRYDYVVEPSWTGSLVTATTGLRTARVIEGVVARDSAANVTVKIPPGQNMYARFSLFDEDIPGFDGLPAYVDLDMYVYKAGATDHDQAGSSTRLNSSTEEVNLNSPAAGAYIVQVEAAGMQGADSVKFKLHVWTLPKPTTATSQSSNLQSRPGIASPASARMGSPQLVSLTLAKGLKDSGKRYLGAVMYSRSSSKQDRQYATVGVTTIVSLV